MSFFGGAAKNRACLFLQNQIIHSFRTLTLKDPKTSRSRSTKKKQRDPPLHGPLHPKPISTGHRVSRADPMEGGMALDEPASSNIG